MFGLKDLYLNSIRQKIAVAFSTIAITVTGSVGAEEPGCCTPAPSCPTIQGGGCCDNLYQSVAERLRCFTDRCAPSCCSPSIGSCTGTEPICNQSPLVNGCGTSCTGGCGSSCGCGCGSGCGLFSEKLGDPWTVMSLFDDDCGKNCLKDNGWVLGGFTQYGYQSDPDGAFAGNGPFVSQKEYQRFAMNQGYLFVGKTADGSKGLGWGFRADLFYGLDGNEGQAFGNINSGRWDFLNGWDHGAYEWALPQLYAELAYDKTSVKIGHFYTIVGYEVIPSNGNFFLSRQLTFNNSEPFTHTGALATYKVSDKLSVSGGWVAGMDTGFYQFASGNSFLGGATYTVDDKTSLIYTMTAGNLGWRGDGAINSLVVTRKWSDKWSTAHQFDVLNSNLTADFNAIPAAGTNNGIAQDSIGLINYAFYEVNSRVKTGVRGEWYKADGTSYYVYTAGLNVKPTANLTVRPEVRYMNSPGNEQIYAGPDFNDKLFNNIVYGVDAIFTF